MNINHTDITIVLDRSGSMSSIAADTIGGFNRFLEDQKKAPGTANLILHQFDNVFETPIPTTAIGNVPALTIHTFAPRGSTALLDAIGRAITETGARLSGMAEDQRPAHVICVIITDGEENSSREFTLEKINEMIKLQQDAYKWEFVFLGANQDAIRAGTSMGIKGGNSMSYAANTIGVCSAFAAVSSNAAMMRSGTKKDMSYTTAQLKEQEDAGA